MTDLTSVFTQHFNTLFNVYFGSYINTGNKIVDNAIITIFNAVFGLTLSYTLYLLLKGGWQIELRRFGLFKKHSTAFNSDAVEVPKNFSFILTFSTCLENQIFSRWMLEYNTNKIKKGSVVVSRSLFSIVDIENKEISDSRYGSGDNWLLQKSLRESLTTPVPIWIGSDQQYVFAVKGISAMKEFAGESAESEYDTMCLCSNSTIALKEVSEDILKFNPEIVRDFEEKEMLKVYKTHFDEMGSRAKIIVEKTGVINARKNFNTLFFKDKKVLLNMLNKLTNKQLGSDVNGLENKLGILLYGPPGTGKTGVIQAIANYTKRSIVMINLSIIKNSKMLDEVFKDKNKKDYIFVFEEIDCMGDVVLKRGSVPDTKKDNTAETMMEMVTAVASMSNGNKNFKPEKSGKLELGHILSKIDGIESNEDAIYIATTNRIDALDEALIRPGRFGFKMELSYCDRDMLFNIISMILNLDEDDKKILYEHIPENAINKIKPVDIIQRCQIENDLVRVLKYLKNY
jgi:hypothetical protein